MYCNWTWKSLSGFRGERVFLLITLPILVLLTTACGREAAEPAPAASPAEAVISPTVAAAEVRSGRGAGDTLRLLLWQAPTTLNPHLSTGWKDWLASRITYEPLASFDAAGELIPFLAAEIPSLENGGVASDGRSVIWKLKQNVKWSDGAPFSAADVLFTYEYLTNPAVNAASAANYNTVDRVEVLDDYTVKLHFKAVNPAWALPFVGVQGIILPRHIFADYNGSNARQTPANLAPVGSGPYRVVAFKTEDTLIIGQDVVKMIKIIYEPNPFFREADKPYFSQVELQGGGDATIATRAMLQEGLVDYAWNLQVAAETLAELEAGGHSSAIFISGPTVERLIINFTDPNRETVEGERSSVQFPHPFFSDQKVRQALAYALDREAIADLYGAAGRPTSNILVSPATYASPNTTYEFNLAKAVALLDEAGWRDSDGDGVRDKAGVKLSLLFQTSVNPVRQQTQELIKETLESVGFEVELKFVDASIFFGDDMDSPNTTSRFYADLQEYADGNVSPDPGEYMNHWTCDQIAQQENSWATFNDGRYCNPAYDVLHQQSRTEMNPEKRRQLLIQMNDLLVEDVAMIPLVHRANVSAISDTLAGFDPTPWDREVWNIKDWRRK